MNINKLNNDYLNIGQEKIDKKVENKESNSSNHQIQKNPIDSIIDDLSLEDAKKLLKEIFKDTKDKINSKEYIKSVEPKGVNDDNNLLNYLKALKYNIMEHKNNFPYQDDLEAMNAYLKYAKTKEGQYDIAKNGILSYIKFMTPEQRIKVIDRLIYAAQVLKENYKNLEDIQLTPTLKVKKWESAPPILEQLYLEEIKNGKIYRHHVDIEPDKGRAFISTYTDDENGNPINVGRYEIREDMVFDMTKGKTGFKKSLPKDVIDLLNLLKNNGVNLGKVNLYALSLNKENKINNLLTSFDGPFGGRGYTIIGGVLGSILFSALSSSIPGGIIVGAIFGFLFGGSIGSLIEGQQAINYALKGNIFYDEKEFKKKTKLSNIL